MNAKTNARQRSDSAAHALLRDRMTDAEYARLLTMINDIARLYAKYDPADVGFHIDLGANRPGVILRLQMEQKHRDPAQR
jgi:hypothetical protein